LIISTIYRCMDVVLHAGGVVTLEVITDWTTCLSSVLGLTATATPRYYGMPKNVTPHRTETPKPIGIKFGTVGYVPVVAHMKKNSCKSVYGNLSANG